MHKKHRPWFMRLMSFFFFVAYEDLTLLLQLSFLASDSHNYLFDRWLFLNVIPILPLSVIRALVMGSLSRAWHTRTVSDASSRTCGLWLQHVWISTRKLFLVSGSVSRSWRYLTALNMNESKQTVDSHRLWKITIISLYEFFLKSIFFCTILKLMS